MRPLRGKVDERQCAYCGNMIDLSRGYALFVIAQERLYYHDHGSCYQKYRSMVALSERCR